MKQSSLHEFALYSQQTQQLQRSVDKLVKIDDLELAHRIITVLRLQKDDQIILFDATHHARVSIQEILSKKNISIKIQSFTINKQLSPSITWLLPVLKRESFETALYSLAELGATFIQPIKTAKSVQSWGAEKDISRVQKIIIAAAEQSKQFAYPQLLPVITLDSYLAKPSDQTKIFFDAAGAPCSQVVAHLKQSPAQSFTLFAGPEGDLTPEEKKKLAEHSFMFCALTPTVLRASQAVAVGLGIFRSLI